MAAAPRSWAGEKSLIAASLLPDPILDFERLVGSNPLQSLFYDRPLRIGKADRDAPFVRLFAFPGPEVVSGAFVVHGPSRASSENRHFAAIISARPRAASRAAGRSSPSSSSSCCSSGRAPAWPSAPSP